MAVWVVFAAAVAAGGRLGVAVDVVVVVVAVCLWDGRRWGVRRRWARWEVLFAAAEEAEAGAFALAELDGLYDRDLFSGGDAVRFGAGDKLLLESGRRYR